MWLFTLVCLTFCFTVGFTSKHKETIVELKEKNMTDKEEFAVEISQLLQEIHALQLENEQLKGARYEQS